MTTRIKFYKQAVQCRDVTTGKVGDFLCESTEEGLVAVSPLFSTMSELFSWLKESQFIVVVKNGLMPWYMEKEKAEKLYLEWVNDWLTPEEMAANYGISVAEMKEILGNARTLHESCASWSA